MTVSGTFLTQLVLTALILFLVPFIQINLKDYIIDTDYKIYLDSSEKEYAIATVENGYVIPINLPLRMLDNDNIYSNPALLKTIILGIIYIALGIFLFKRRKMEDTEESFKDERIHLLVKALTVFPMIVFLNAINPTKVVKIFIIAMISIYFFAYDFIVKRKVKLFISIISLIVTIGISYGIAIGMEKFAKDVSQPSQKIYASDIQQVAVNLSRKPSNQLNNYFIKDSEIVKMVTDELKNNIVVENSDYYRNQDDEFNAIFSVSYKTKSGKILTGTCIIHEKENLYKLLELLSKDEKYVSAVKNQYTKKGKVCVSEKVLPEELQEAVNLELKKIVDKMSLTEIYEKLIISNNKYYSEVEKVFYGNHQYTDLNLNIDISAEIEKIILNYQNQFAKEYIEKMNNSRTRFRIVGKTYSNELNNFEFVMNKEYYYDPFEFSYTDKDILNFIKDNIDEQPDPAKPFYQIQYYIYDIGYYNIFYTNKIDEINQIIKKEYDYDIKMYENTSTQDTVLLQ